MRALSHCPVVVLSPGPARSFLQGSFPHAVPQCVLVLGVVSPQGRSWHFLCCMSQGFFHSISFHSQSDQVPCSTNPAVNQPLFPVLFISEGAEGVPHDSGMLNWEGSNVTTGDGLQICATNHTPSALAFQSVFNSPHCPVIWHKLHHPVCNDALANSVKSFTEGEITSTAVPLENHIHTFKPSLRVQISHYLNAFSDSLRTTSCLLRK